ncbi:MAG: glycosyltransferase [Eubacterium sp.]|nr:glycosyltransferase [Eubacterium sp.]
MSEEVQISIICITYNHEKYIRQCLDGFLMQKDVTFEIIIHDDASTDKTSEVIREYELMYPGLLKPIYQTENQYSKNPIIIDNKFVPYIQGKYVAICEGDDYWTDPFKLKKQFDALEANPDCVMCAHKVNVVNNDGTDLGYTCPRKDIQTIILPIGYICMNYDNAKYIHTNSCFINASDYKQYLTNMPNYRLVAPVGDVPLLLYFTSIGKIYYFNEVMSNYRFMSIGSWTYQNENDPEKEQRRRNIYKRMKEMFVEFCKFTGGKYDECFISEIKKYDMNEYWYCIKHQDYKSLFTEFTIKELKEFGLDNKAILKMKLQIYFPFVFK